MKSISLCKCLEVLFALPRFASKKALQALLLERALGRFSLDELALELAMASLLVTVDTGIMHLAKFTGIPVVAMLAGTMPQRVRPSAYFGDCPFHAFQSDVKCERKNPSCSALLRFCLQIEDGYSRCMRKLPMDRILSCIEGILKGEARA
ncbi:MAG: glycosyltransferase family 9 protein [Aeromonadales bacterium]|nr:glycosyltransferase family 9 protein [Aeromonadales bacterium]MDY2890183.1 glycosyltransferase family 9 protein [Succinivibrio sp.]